MKRVILVSLAFTAMLIQLGMAANHDVGDNSGWDTSSNISTWSSSRTFLVGDNLGEFVFCDIFLVLTMLLLFSFTWKFVSKRFSLTAMLDS